MLFFVSWKDRASLLVSAEAEAAARAIATDVAGGVAPGALRELPDRAFVAEVTWEPDARDPDLFELVIEPLDHVVDLLAALDDEDVGDPAPGLARPYALCGDRIEDGAGVLVCALSAGHGGDHQGTDATGAAVCWGRDG